MVPEEYRKWQSLNGQEGQVNKINRLLGGTMESPPWRAINEYLPDNESLYSKYKILSKYSEEKEGIEVEFGPEFSNSLRYLPGQVVFKVSKDYENILVAELLDGKEEYDLGLPDNYQLLSWTMTRINSRYDHKDYESALVTMEWMWEGKIDGENVKIKDELQWAWHPYEPK